MSSLEQRLRSEHERTYTHKHTRYVNQAYPTPAAITCQGKIGFSGRQRSKLGGAFRRHPRQDPSAPRATALGNQTVCASLAMLDGQQTAMWRGCNVPCPEAMMNDAATGCRGAWYTTNYWTNAYNGHVWDGTGSSCTQKCASLGLRCDLETIRL